MPEPYDYEARGKYEVFDGAITTCRSFLSLIYKNSETLSLTEVEILFDCAGEHLKTAQDALMEIKGGPEE